MSNVYTKSINVPPTARNKRIYAGDYNVTNTGNNPGDTINYLKGLTIEQINALLLKYKTKHGFLMLDDNDILWDDISKVFTMALVPQELPDGTYTESFETWQYGYKLMKETENLEILVLDDIPSDWHIGYDSNGVLEAKQDKWNTFLDVPICTLRWDGTTGELTDERRPILTTWDKQPMQLWRRDETKILGYPYKITDYDFYKFVCNLQSELLGIGMRNTRNAMIQADQYGLGDVITKLWELKNTFIDTKTFDALIDADGLLLRFIGAFKLTNNDASVKLLTDKSVEIKDKAVTPALKITTSPAVDYIPISDADGNLPLGALKKSMVEGCLTGNITSHTHDQYLESGDVDLTNIIRNDGATIRIDTAVVKTNAQFNEITNKDDLTLYVIVG